MRPGRFDWPTQHVNRELPMRTGKNRNRQLGFTMIEVLVTLVILLFGLLGLVGLQTRAQVAETESYQRTQALVLLRDMADRISANRSNASSYAFVVTAPLGSGSTIYGSAACQGLAPLTQVDLCEWDAALKGVAEASGACNQQTGANCVGAMIGARGCITSPAANQYLIQVVWQGMAKSAAPPSSVACGSGSYGDDMQRRAVTTVVQIGVLS
jgi:type IV pilus assembly protein PilV